MLRILILAIGLAASVAAVAQVRSIPAEARRGLLTHIQGTSVNMRHAGFHFWWWSDGKTLQLSSGAQIRDASNLIIPPTAVPPGSLVKYTLDEAGYVHRVWILTQQEAAQRDNR
jgi:hypothetical protein